MMKKILFPFAPFFVLSAVFSVVSVSAQETPKQVSGVYPHLAMFNNEAECGTGAVVPWADRLWVVTYGPHLPLGSTDKLYEITPELEQVVRPESVGGTHANRMIHKESEQLFIGYHAIDKDRNVRTIPPKKMPGRQTGNARHLTDPAGKIYYATMEEGLYEVDVKTLDVTGLIKDGNPNKAAQEDRPATVKSELPGYHGKGLYSGQGRVVYANNGDRGPRVMFDSTVDSGALGQWSKPGEDWELVRRNQFTEVTGPGGIYGNENIETDPIWSIGWDHRSLILMVLHEGKWSAYRLPKASHTYDGAHGWHTEWPRIRDIGDESLLMTMHGTFWKFPKTFTPKNTAGIVPRSTYLKVIGDFCNWNGKVVCACDDTAQSEFTNKRKVKGELIGPGQSQSNLWFLDPEQLDSFGPLLGRGGPWINEPVKAGEWSNPYLFAGYEHRMLQLKHNASESVTVTLELDENGDGNWKEFATNDIPDRPEGLFSFFPPQQKGIWIRMKTDKDVENMTAMFQYRNSDPRGTEPMKKFDGLAKLGEEKINGGVIHARGGGLKTLRFIAHNEDGLLGAYDLDGELNLKKADDPAGLKWTSEKAAIPVGVLDTDEASVLLIDEKGRWRLPKGDPARDKDGPLGPERVCREVATERDLFHAHGTFYELPAENSGGFQKIRPVASHPYRIKDYASFRGMIVLSGLSGDLPSENPHVVKSDDGKCALWCGVIDDLWELGKVRGVGGPWKNSAVKAGVPSDPYLMAGYDKKSIEISHDTVDTTVEFRIEIDVCGNGQWTPAMTVKAPNKTEKINLPFDAYWVRVIANKDVNASATFFYE